MENLQKKVDATLKLYSFIFRMCSYPNYFNNTIFINYFHHKPVIVSPNVKHHNVVVLYLLYVNTKVPLFGTQIYFRKNNIKNLLKIKKNNVIKSIKVQTHKDKVLLQKYGFVIIWLVCFVALFRGC
jgi:hypothetical protein